MRLLGEREREREVIFNRRGEKMAATDDDDVSEREKKRLTAAVAASLFATKTPEKSCRRWAPNCLSYRLSYKTALLLAAN